MIVGGGSGLCCRNFRGRILSKVYPEVKGSDVIAGVNSKGHGTISSAVDELKITSALVVLREDGTVLITVCAEMQLQAEGTWKMSNSSLISPRCWNIFDGFEDYFP